MLISEAYGHMVSFRPRRKMHFSKEKAGCFRDMKDGKLVVLLVLSIFLLTVITACVGKGNNDGPPDAVDSAAVESTPGLDALGQAGPAGVDENPESPDGHEVEAAAATIEQPAQQGEQPATPVTSSSTAKPGDHGKQVPAITEKVGGNQVTLWITSDYGTNTMFKKTVELQTNWTVLDVLQSNVTINTSHGGSFINSINGLESRSSGFGGKKHDWFYYVNGTFADVGVLDYYPRAGDMIWWDYHLWDNMSVYPAVVGCYPAPFVNGYRGKAGPVTIMSSTDNRSLAGKLQAALQAKGAATVSIVELNEALMKRRSGPTIVLGQWSELSEYKWLVDLNKAYIKNGTCVHFTGDQLVLLDYRGQAARKVAGSAGIIAATGTGSGDASPLWLVVGTDQEGLRQAVDILAERPGKIAGLYNAAVMAGEVISLPLQ